MLALAADQVWCRAGAVLNPHYRLMGLHGSEFWTYTLPRRVGAGEAARLTQACLPVTPASALRSGLVDRVIAEDAPGFRAQVADLAQQLARSPDYPSLLSAKARQLAAAERQCPLDAYRAAELAIMNRNFSDPREPYAGLRRAFVHKEKPSHTPLHLARHRTQPQVSRPARHLAQAGVLRRTDRGSRHCGCCLAWRRSYPGEQRAGQVPQAGRQVGAVAEAGNMVGDRVADLGDGAGHDLAEQALLVGELLVDGLF
jgi:hypothetical protein